MRGESLEKDDSALRCLDVSIQHSKPPANIKALDDILKQSLRGHRERYLKLTDANGAKRRICNKPLNKQLREEPAFPSTAPAKCTSIPPVRGKQREEYTWSRNSQHRVLRHPLFSSWHRACARSSPR